VAKAFTTFINDPVEDFGGFISDDRSGSEMTNTADQTTNPNTTGLVLHRAFGYDLLVGLLTLGAERRYREETLSLAGLKAGEAVLDVGCGTGSLAIAAKRHVGPIGAVHGIDASIEMIEGARRKAQKAGVEVVFEDAVVEKLPFPDATFDVVFSTTMFHHLADKARRQCLGEIRRVLRPGGRLLAVDFGGPVSERRSWIAKLHRHGRIDLQRLIPVVNEVGLKIMRSGPIRQRFGLMSDLYFLLAGTSAT
jgi:ubiquinone/menaquinone biosynthesis C-methylase UbiE